MKKIFTSLYCVITDKQNIPIFCLLIFAFLIRIIGIDFGLPLWVVPDEPAIVYAPLKMIELHSLIPAWHFEAFVGKFYYMPFIAYIYIVPFIFVLGAKFLLFSGTMAEFKNVLQLDLSAFFITVRVVNALIGTATVYVVYKTSENIFKNKKTALYSAAFLCFGLLHIIFSHWTRHWVVSAFAVSLVLYVLSHPVWSKEKRYLIAATICGIGVGMMLEISILTLLMVIWFFLYDKLSIAKELKQKWTWLSVAIFFSIFILASLIWPKGPYLFHTKGNSTYTVQNVIYSLSHGYIFYFFDILKRETSLLIFFIVGAAAGFRKMRKYVLPIIAGVMLYTFLLYSVFNDLSRLILFIYPLLAIVAGYGLSEFANIFKKRKAVVNIVIGLSFLPLIVNAVLVDYLLVKNDTRTQALEWIDKNIPAQSKILVLAPAMRLSSTRASIEEQEKIDPASLRTVEQVERKLDDRFFTAKRFNALNLHAVESDIFYKNLRNYIVENEYEFAVFDEDFAKTKGMVSSPDEFGIIIQEYNGNTFTAYDEPTDGARLSLKRLLSLQNFGPGIKIYKVNEKNICYK